MKYIINKLLIFTLLLGAAACSSDDDDLQTSIQQIALPADFSLAVGNTIQLQPTTTPATITKPYELQWGSSNESVATVSDDGTVTALAAGTTIIRVEAYENGVSTLIAAFTELTVENYTLTLSESTANLEIGSTLTLEPTVTPTGSTYTLVWSSSNETVATVDQNGVVTARNEGEATITVSIQEQPSVTATFQVNVGAGEVNPGSGVEDIPDGGDW